MKTSWHLIMKKFIKCWGSFSLLWNQNWKGHFRNYKELWAWAIYWFLFQMATIFTCNSNWGEKSQVSIWSTHWVLQSLIPQTIDHCYMGSNPRFYKIRGLNQGSQVISNFFSFSTIRSCGFPPCTPVPLPPPTHQAQSKSQKIKHKIRWITNYFGAALY